MTLGIGPRQKCSFTLSPRVVKWIESKAREHKVSRSKLVDQVLGEESQKEKEEQMKEGYNALRDILKATAKASASLQRKVIPDY